MKVEISECFYRKSIINYLDGLNKGVGYVVFLEDLREWQYFSKEGSKTNCSGNCNASELRGSENNIMCGLKVCESTFFLSVAKSIITLTHLSLVFESLSVHANIRVHQAISENVWEDVNPCLALELGQCIWAGRGVRHSILVMKSSWSLKGRAASRTLLRGHWKKDTMGIARKAMKVTCYLSAFPLFACK